LFFEYESNTFYFIEQIRKLFNNTSCAFRKNYKKRCSYIVTILKSTQYTKNKEKIELFFIPSYSPDRNPNEYLNCDLKQGLSIKKSPKYKETLQQNVQNHMDMLSENPNRIVKYFKHQAIQYAA